MIDGGRIVALEVEIDLAAPSAAQVCTEMSRMRCSIRSSESIVNVRAVPRNTASVGTTLSALPAWICVMLSTAASSGLRLRVIDGLQRVRQLHRGHDGVDAQVGHAGMRALARGS